MCSKIENVPVSFLIDTGSNVTILSKKFLSRFPQEFCQTIIPTNMKLLSVTGEVTPFHGKTEVIIEIGSQKIPHTILIADIENEGILGMDFLADNHCDIMLSRQFLKINGEKIRCFANSREAQARCCRIAVSEFTVIPPQTEIVVEGFPTSTIDRRATGLLETDSKFLHKKGLLVAKALVCFESGTVPVRIANPYDQKLELNKHTIVATFEPLEPEELLSVNTAKTVSNSDSTYSETDIPEHLQDLYSNSSEHLSEHEKSQLKQLLIKYQNSFSKSSHDLGRTSIIEHTINLVPDTRPIKQPPYRLPLAKRQEAEHEIKAMAEMDLIEPSTSPWSAPAIMVPKKNGKLRLCVDYRRLNKKTIPDSQPLPHIGDSLDALGGAKWFSTLDLKMGFHQVSVAEQDRPKTAFSIPGSGLWQFKVMPFGATNSPAVFERLMERIFAGLTYVTLLIYLDDIIVFGKTFEVHLQNLEEVFLRLKEANLKINAEKCLFFQKQTIFLGHLVSDKGICSDPTKTKSVQEWPIPRTVTEVRSFVGLCSYLRKFIPNISTVCKPLHVLTEKGRSFNWCEECQIAFNTLKSALISAPILAFPQGSGEFILDCDASNVALGAVLSQIQDGEERVIAYYSKCFSRTERNYCTTRREFLAVVSSIKYFHHYLYGRHFTVRSDHGSLRWLMKFKNIEGQIARWLETLASYDFEIVHRSGRLHSNADSLSRRPCLQDNCKYCSNVDSRYATEDPGVATRASWIVGESTNMGECIEKVGTIRMQLEIDGLAPPDKWTIKGKSSGSVDVHLQKLTSENSIPECFNTWGIRKSTSLPTILSQDCSISREFSFRNEDDFNVSVSNVTHCTEKSGTGFYGPRRGSFSYINLCTGQPGIGENLLVSSDDDMKTSAVRNIDIECMTPENIRFEQDQDPVIKQIKQWKLAGSRPVWTDVAEHGIELKVYWNQWKALLIIDDLLYKKNLEGSNSGENENQIVLPSSLRKTAFVLLHETATSGHLGQQKTYTRIKQRFYWYHCKEDIEYWCRACDVCASRKQPYRKAKAPMKQYNVGYPLERIAIDIMGPLPITSNKARYLLVVSCYFTKWLDAIPINTIDAKTVATKLIEKFISVFGVPMQLHSDQGSNFESQVFQEVCNILGIQKTRTTPGRPQSDGMIERACRSIQAMLSAFVSQNQKDWDTHIPLLMMAYRSSVHDTTKCTPSAMMLGREIRLPIDLALGLPEKRQSKCETDYAYELEKHLVETHNFARKHMQVSSDGMKTYYDKSANFTEFSVGDIVWFHNPVRKPGLSLKLQRPWKGPYVIVEKMNEVLYKIKDNPRGKPKLVHYDRLKVYQGENKPTWFINEN